MRAFGTVAAILGIFVLGVVLLWPSPAPGPEPILFGRDTCDYCRMHLSQSGFAGEAMGASGGWRKYDDIGCMLSALGGNPATGSELWVEDNAGAGLVLASTATCVTGRNLTTPMGSGIVAFKNRGAAEAFARANGAAVSTFQHLMETGVAASRAALPPADPGT